VVSVQPVGRLNEAPARRNAVIGRQAKFAIAALSVTQIIGWGSLLFMPAVLGRSIQAELAMSAELTFAGVTSMYVVAAAIAPIAGCLIDRFGSHPVMAAGSLAGAVGLAGLAYAEGPAGYFVAWTILGATCALALTNAACAAVAQAAGDAAMRGITALMFVTGLAGTVSLPTIYFFEGVLGWRGTCLLLAAAHLTVCLPLHLSIPRGALVHGTRAKDGYGRTATESRHWQSITFGALAAALGLNVFVTAGFSVHLVGLLRAAGFADAMAVSLASLVGLAQVGARAVQFLAVERWQPTAFAIVGAILLPLAMGIMLVPFAVSGRPEFATTVMFILVLGISNGLMMVARTAVPAQIFGFASYGRWTGRLGAFQNAATAVTPVVFAAALSLLGVVGTLLMAACAALLSMAALIILMRCNGPENAQQAARSSG
jgi:MFS family permease